MSYPGGSPPTADDPWGRAGDEPRYASEIPPYDPPPPLGSTGSTYQDHAYQPVQAPYAPYVPYPQHGYGQQSSYAPYPPAQLVPYGQPYPRAGYDGMAIASMICGIGSILLLCGAPATGVLLVLALGAGATAVTLGFVSCKRIVTSVGARTGRGMAIAGIVCGFCTVGIGLVGALLAGLLFALAAGP